MTSDEHSAPRFPQSFQSIVDYMPRPPWPWGLFATIALFGFAFVYLSHFVGLDDVTYRHKQVGFLHSINWSLGIAFVPALLASSLSESLRRFIHLSISAALPHSCSIRLLRAMKSWNTIAALLALILTICSLSLVEWYEYCWTPIHDPQRPLPDFVELDWSTASRFVPGVSVPANAAYSFFAYLITAVCYSLLVTGAICLLYATVLIDAHTQFSTHVLPQSPPNGASSGQKSNHPTSFVAIPVSTFVTVLMADMTLTRLHNIYLRAGDYDSEWRFLLVEAQQWSRPFASAPQNFKGSFNNAQPVFAALGLLLLATAAWIYLFERRYRSAQDGPAWANRLLLAVHGLNMVMFLGGMFWFRVTLWTAPIAVALSIGLLLLGPRPSAPQPKNYISTSEHQGDSVFVCYSHRFWQERNVVCEVLCANGLGVWVDVRNLSAHVNWISHLRTFVGEAIDVAVVIVGNQALGPAQCAELELFHEYETRLITYVLPGGRPQRDQHPELMQLGLIEAKEGIFDATALARMIAACRECILMPPPRSIT